MRYYLSITDGRKSTLVELKNVDEMVTVANGTPPGATLKAFRGWPVDLVVRQVYAVGRASLDVKENPVAKGLLCVGGCGSRVPIKPPGTLGAQRVFCEECRSQRKAAAEKASKEKARAKRASANQCPEGVRCRGGCGKMIPLRPPGVRGRQKHFCVRCRTRRAQQFAKARKLNSLADRQTTPTTGNGRSTWPEGQPQ